jgi:hypothetical protein
MLTWFLSDKKWATNQPKSDKDEKEALLLSLLDFREIVSFCQ